MLTKNEITALNLSPTKKDFVQIWNELLDVAKKLSERWDPTSTNESDPGIVLLKALTGIADKLNYNIDKNTLEAFMPTAAQEESMRKICEMLGYNMKYYQSAETEVTIKYYNADPSEEERNAMDRNNPSGGVTIPKFTTITNVDGDISYFTVNQASIDYSGNTLITDKSPIITLPCMEGQIVKCESINENNLITIDQIVNNKFYLPETQIAENGIFVYSPFTDPIFTNNILQDGEPWKKVQNLNVCTRGSKVFKFGFDSQSMRPYLEFPEDYSSLFNEGIFIYYTRTTGSNGNVSANTLTRIELPSGGNWDSIAAESFSVENKFAATTGSDAETIGQAYNNFKKTIGTFDTLVTCRDYMNKIYMLTNSSNKNIVSNILVTDIRNDINRAITICSCDDFGILYKEQSVEQKQFSDTDTDLPTVKLIDHFDLVLYPFKTYNQIRGNIKNISSVYNSSFEYTNNQENIENLLDDADIKTIAHTFKAPEPGHILSINNYLKLDAFVSTNAKVTAEEGEFIIENIKKALSNAFNMRELDFGEEIPFDSILSVVEKADSRIKTVVLNDPTLYTTFSVLNAINNGTPEIYEYAVASSYLSSKDAAQNKKIIDFDSTTAKKIYNKLVLRNILAGRVPLFNYEETFKTSFSEAPLMKTTTLEQEPEGFNLASDESFKINADNDGVLYVGQKVNDSTIYTKIEPISATLNEQGTKPLSLLKDEINQISQLDTACDIKTENGKVENLVLGKGEFVKFRAPNFNTVVTYPAYVNYHLDLDREKLIEARPAVGESLFNILNSTDNNWDKLFTYFKNKDKIKTATITKKVSKYGDNQAETDYTNSPIIIEIDNNNESSTQTESLRSLLNNGGCLKLTNPENEGEPYQAVLKWDTSSGDSAPIREVLSQPIQLRLDSPFITDYSLIESITNEVDEQLTLLVQNADTAQILPTECDWTISFTFECVPFDATTLSDWNTFINNNPEIVDFTPQAEDGVKFYRRYGNAGEYNAGKYISEAGYKYLKFDQSYLGSLPESTLTGVYLIADFGSDVAANIIQNNEDYELKDNEFLYIEYTPSATSEDGSLTSTEPITKTYGKGTIIRPTGFTTELCDSDLLVASAYKNVKFGNTEVSMYTLGANEQIEIRDFSRVVLDSNSVVNGSVYVYKNFSCPVLETSANRESINDIQTVSYTLKDGEFIFYTDANKSDFAYFSSGTQVTLKGSEIIPSAEIIEPTTIFESGLEVIPWNRFSLQGKNSIIFQDYQYITLGEGDKVNSIVLCDSNSEITKDWQDCVTASYYPVTNQDKLQTLPIIRVGNLKEGSCGWEVCSLFELNVSPSTSQILRNTGVIQTSLIPKYVSRVGGDKNEVISKIDGIETDKITPPEGQSFAFSTNIACQSNGSSLNLSELYSSATLLNGFEIKVFKPEPPCIVKTVAGKIMPYMSTDSATSRFDILSWEGEPLPEKASSDLWNTVSLLEIKADKDGINYDNALKLSVNLLPDTYGVACFYLRYTSSLLNMSTWIESFDGIDLSSAVSLINYDCDPSESQKLYLNNGINCVQFKKSGRYFIKTSAGSQGSLFFDDLRLVKVQVIEESIVNSETKEETTYTYNTQGLNLNQLGYLPVEEQTTDDNIAAKILFDSAIKDLTNKSSSFERESYAAAGSVLNNIQVLPKVVEGREALVNNYNYLQEYSNNAPDSLKNLKDEYIKINAALDKENDVLKIFNSHVDITHLEQLLLDMVTSLNSPITGEYRNTLKNDINILINKINEQPLRNYTKADCENYSSIIRSDKHILSNFSRGADYVEQIPSLLKSTVIESIEKRILDITTKLADSADSGLLDQIVMLLDNIQKAKDAQDLQNAINVVTALRETLDRFMNPASDGSVSSLLTSLKGSCAAYDFINAMTYSNQLDATLKFNNLDTELSLLTNVIANLGIKVQDESEISKIIDKLEEYLAFKGPSYKDGNETKYYFSDINAALKDIQGDYEQLELDEETGVLQITDSLKAKIGKLDSKISDLETEINKIYLTDDTAEFKDLLQTLEGLLIAPATSSLRNIINELRELASSTSDKVTKNLITQLSSLVDERETIEEANIQITNINLPDITTVNMEELLSTIFAQCEKDYIIAVLNSFKNYLDNNNFSKIAFYNNFYIEHAKNKDIKALFQKLNTAAQTALADQNYINALAQLEYFISADSEILAALEDIDVYSSNSYLSRLEPAKENLTNLLLPYHQSVVTINFNKTTIENSPAKAAINLSNDNISLNSSLSSLTLKLTNNTNIDQIVNITPDKPEVVDISIGSLVGVTNSNNIVTCVVKAEETVNIICSRKCFGKVNIKISTDSDPIETLEQTLRGTAEFIAVLKESINQNRRLLSIIEGRLLKYIDPFLSTLDANDWLAIQYSQENGCLYEIGTFRKNVLDLLKGQVDAISGINNMAAYNDKTEKIKQFYDTFKIYTSISSFIRTLNNDKNREELFFKINDSEELEKVVPVIFEDELNIILNSILANYLIACMSNNDFVNTDNGATYREAIIEAISNIVDIVEQFKPDDASEAEELPAAKLFNAVLVTLKTNLEALQSSTSLASEAFKNIYCLERQLLTDIRELDVNRDFYYSVPIDQNLAIDFTDTGNGVSSLLNPASNYDVNNINNNFVISKLDIDYLSNGIKIARSSRLN